MRGYVELYLTEELQEGETIVYSFYVSDRPSFSEYFSLQMGSFLKHKYNMVTLTNKRLIINQMNAAGKMKGISIEMGVEEIEEFKVKRGPTKTTVEIIIWGHSVIFNPNNICIDMPYHKDSLLEMARVFK